jgi:hypothetical protein
MEKTMKKVIAALTMTMLMVGCGDETNIYGYTDEDVQNMFVVFKDSIVRDITDSLVESSKDTVYKISKDTVYKISKDTVYKISKDTLRLVRTDTVYSVVKKDSIVYVNTTDTVFNVIKDSALIRIVDSVYHQRGFIINEIPRDTSITLYDTTELESEYTVISKTWNGFVYKDVFYDTTVYQSSSGVSFPERYYNDGSSKYYCWHQCGSKISPDFNSSTSGCWKTSEAMRQRFDGWRIFNLEDVISLGSNLGTVISQDSIYIAHTTGVSTRSANYYRITSSGEIVLTSGVKYLCAYDLVDK